MKKEESRILKARLQRLETLISEFDNDVQLLHESGVDVSVDTEVNQRQTEIQDEMEQVISDLLLVLDTSGNVEAEDGTNIDLPNTGRQPVSAGTLPDPKFERPEGRGDPAWSNGNN